MSEVKVLMDNQVATREHPSDTQCVLFGQLAFARIGVDQIYRVFKKTYDYVNSFARFSDSERVFAVRVYVPAWDHCQDDIQLALSCTVFYQPTLI